VSNISKNPSNNKTSQSTEKPKTNKQKTNKFTFTRNIPIGVKYLIIFLISAALFLVATIAVYTQLNQAENNVEQIIYEGELSDNISQLALLIEQIDSVISQYIIIGSDQYVAQFKTLNDDLENLFESLTSEFANQDDQLFILTHIINNQEKIADTFLNKITSNTLTDDELVYAHIEIGTSKSSSVTLTSRLIGNINESREAATKVVTGSMAQSKLFLILVNVISILSGLIVMYLISRIISRHLQNVVHMTATISKGDLSVESVDYVGRDEIGQISAAINMLKENMKNIIQRVAVASDSVSNSSGILTASARDIHENGSQMVTTMGELASGAENQASSAVHLSEQMHEFVQSVELSQNEGEAITESSKRVLDLTTDGTKLMQQSVSQMSAIDTIVSEAVTKVQGLDQQSDEISQLVEVVKDIADQTNLLALNAAIEAARAGEHGRGFSIVADEVRKLAEQVTNSVNEITHIVGNIQHETNEVVASLNTGYDEVQSGIEQIEKTGSSFAIIDESVTEMVNNISEIANRLKNIAENSQKMNQSIEEIASISEEAAAGVEETSASSEEILSAMNYVTTNAQELAKLSDQLNEEVAVFKL